VLAASAYLCTWQATVMRAQKMEAQPPFASLAVLGSGVMGHGIALVAAQRGLKTWLYDLNDDLLGRARAQVEAFWAKSVEKGKLSPEAHTAASSRLHYTTRLEDLAVDFILEAIPERLELKRDVFARLQGLFGDGPVLATNTSSIPVTQIAAGLPHPHRVVGMHFFNPAPLMQLVEVIAGEETPTQLAEQTAALARHLGKTPAHVRDTPGFIVNRVARFYYLEALRIAEENTAQPHDIDTLMRATGFRMGPFELMDLIGVDTNHAVTQSVYHAFYEEPRFRPSRLQQKKVEAGHHGRKTKRGFYTY
jgi:3-hydroxybutyryl-CoA dehydrogenase